MADKTSIKKMLVNEARCMDCPAVNEAANVKPWAAVHCRRYGHTVEVSLKYRVFPVGEAVRDTYISNAAQLKAADKEAAALEALEALQDLREDIDSVRQDFLAWAVPDHIDGLTTRDIGAALGHHWSGKSAAITRTLCQVLRENGYYQKQRNMGKQVLWAWYKAR
jgi:hypothetical protein